MEVLIDALSTRRQIYSSPSSSVFSYPPSFPFLVRFPGMRETLTPLCLGSSGRGRRTGELRGTSERRPKILPFNELLIVSHDDIKRRSRVQSRSRVSRSVSPGPSSWSSEVLPEFSIDQDNVTTDQE